MQQATPLIEEAEEKWLSHLFVPLDEIKFLSKIPQASKADDYIGVYKEEKILIRVWNDFPSFKRDVDITLILASNPHVVQLKKVHWSYQLQFGLEKPQYLLLMEHMPGGSLFNLFNEKPALPLRECLLIAVDMTTALNSLHQLNIPHQKLTSSNILLDSQYQAKLTDFSPRDFKTCIKEYGYAAPEILSEGESNLPADIFSLGAILMALIKWEDPKYHPHQELLSLTEDACPLELKKLIQQCWEKKPEDRPTALQVMTTLKQILFTLDQSTDSKLIKTDSQIQQQILALLGAEEKDFTPDLKEPYPLGKEAKLAYVACQHQDPKILKYLFPAIKELKEFKEFDIKKVLLHCFYQSIINPCLPNIEYLLQFYQINAYSFEFNKVDLYVDLSLLFDNGKLNTSAPSVDIFLLLYKNNIPLFGTPFIDYVNLSVAERVKSTITREFAALQMIKFWITSKALSKEQYKNYYFQLLDALSHSVFWHIPVFFYKVFFKHINVFQDWHKDKMDDFQPQPLDLFQKVQDGLHTYEYELESKRCPDLTKMGFDQTEFLTACLYDSSTRMVFYEMMDSSKMIVQEIATIWFNWLRQSPQACQAMLFDIISIKSTYSKISLLQWSYGNGSDNANVIKKQIIETIPDDKSKIEQYINANPLPLEFKYHATLPPPEIKESILAPPLASTLEITPLPLPLPLPSPSLHSSTTLPISNPLETKTESLLPNLPIDINAMIIDSLNLLHKVETAIEKYQLDAKKCPNLTEILSKNSMGFNQEEFLITCLFSQPACRIFFQMMDSRNIINQERVASWFRWLRQSPQACNLMLFETISIKDPLTEISLLQWAYETTSLKAQFIKKQIMSSLPHKQQEIKQYLNTNPLPPEFIKSKSRSKNPQRITSKVLQNRSTNKSLSLESMDKLLLNSLELFPQESQMPSSTFPPDSKREIIAPAHPAPVVIIPEKRKELSRNSNAITSEELKLWRKVSNAMKAHKLNAEKCPHLAEILTENRMGFNQEEFLNACLIENRLAKKRDLTCNIFFKMMKLTHNMSQKIATIWFDWLRQSLRVCQTLFFDTICIKNPATEISLLQWAYETDSIRSQFIKTQILTILSDKQQAAIEKYFNANPLLPAITKKRKAVVQSGSTDKSKKSRNLPVDKAQPMADSDDESTLPSETFSSMSSMQEIIPFTPIPVTPLPELGVTELNQESLSDFTLRVDAQKGRDKYGMFSSSTIAQQNQEAELTPHINLLDNT